MNEQFNFDQMEIPEITGIHGAFRLNTVKQGLYQSGAGLHQKVKNISDQVSF